MAYNLYDGASNILNLKGQWETADEEKRKEIENKAKAHYKNLIDNGYGEVANQLQNSNYQQAQGVVKGIGKSGKTAGRKYMTDILTGKYGMTQAQANNAITWDEHSGDVSLGGVNVGKGDVLIDGTNYYSDKSVLDNAVKEYAKNKGLQVSNDLLYNQGKQNFQDISNKYADAIFADRDEFHGHINDYFKQAYTSPFETDTGKGILDYYAQAAEKAGYNQIASGAGANGGNIDSYSQANAIRQNAALRSQGEMAAINAHQSSLGGILGGIQEYRAGNQDSYGALNSILNLMYNDNQQTFDNGETAKNNQMDRWVKESEIKGYVPNELITKDNPFLDKNGNLLNPDQDFEALYVIPALNTLNDPNASEEAKTGARNMYNWAQEAKLKKINTYDEYKQYAGTVRGYIQPVTQRERENVRQTDLVRYGYDTDAATQKYLSDNALKGTMDTNATGVQTTQIQADSNEKIADKELEAVTHDNAIKEQQEQQKAMNEKTDRSANNINEIFHEEEYDKGEGVPVIMKGVDGKYYFNSNLDRSAWLDKVISAVLRDSSLDAAEKLYFLDKLEISTDDVSRVKGYLGI